MDLLNILSLSAGVIGAVGTVIGAWLAHQQKVSSHARKSDLETINAIATQAIVSQNVDRLVTALQSIAIASSPKKERSRELALANVIDEDQMLATESSDRVKGVWLLTHDLQPDRTKGSKVAGMVNRNLQRGVHIIYFIPPGIEDLASLRATLFDAIGVQQGDPRVRIVPTSPVLDYLFEDHANTVFYFADSCFVTPVDSYKEICQAREVQKGILWQRLPTEYMHKLLEKLRPLTSHSELPDRAGH